MRSTTAAATLVLLAALGTACGTTEPEGTGPTTAPGLPSVSERDVGFDLQGFDVRLATAGESYGPDETVTFTLTVCNGDQPVTSSGTGGSELSDSFVIHAADGTRVADDSHRVRTTELLIVRWQPGQCREVTGTWDQHFWNRPEDVASAPPTDTGGLPVVGGLVPAGEYRVVMGGVAATFSLTR